MLWFVCVSVAWVDSFVFGCCLRWLDVMLIVLIFLFFGCVLVLLLVYVDVFW